MPIGQYAVDVSFEFGWSIPVAIGLLMGNLEEEIKSGFWLRLPMGPTTEYVITKRETGKKTRHP